jgi:hypothetical protein
MPEIMARSDPRASVRVTLGAGSGQHLVSVLQERRENANIDAGLGFIWRISAWRPSMKPTISAFVLLSTATTALAQANPTCINGDPSSVLAGINGNFELLVDPQDPARNVIYTNNVATGASSVVVARIDGLSGQVMPGSL